MREDVRDSIGPSDTQYDQLLRDSIDLQCRAEASEGVLQSFDPSGPSSSAAERRNVTRRVNDLMLRRVALLRRTESFTTIEDAFPPVRPVPDEKRTGRDAQAILDAYFTGTIGSPAAVSVASDVDSPSNELSASEWEAFCQARTALATELGYSAGYDDAHTADAQMSKWFVIRKGSLTFEMQHFALASAPAVLGRSRISFLRVTAKTGNSVTEHLAFDRTWMTFCTDPAVQREVDRVVAVFA